MHGAGEPESKVWQIALLTAAFMLRLLAVYILVYAAIMCG